MKASAISHSPAARPARRSGFAIRMLMVVDRRDLLLRQPLFGANLGKVQRTEKPADSRFDAKLGSELDRAWIVEAAEGDADAIGREAPVGQWRAAFGAKAALGDVRTREGRDCAFGDDELGKLDAAKGHERTAARLLAHPAMADVGAVRRGEEPIAHRAALASPREAGRRIDHHRPGPPAFRTPPRASPSASPRPRSAAQDAPPFPEAYAR